MNFYSLPSGYSCITRNGDTLYAYTSNRLDTYNINGFYWQKTSSQSYSGYSYNQVCLSDNQYPSAFPNFLILPSVILVLSFFHVIFNIYKGIRRR